MLALPLLTVLPLALGLTVPFDTTLKSFTHGKGDVKLGRPARPDLAQVNGALTHVSNLDLNTGAKPRHLNFNSVTNADAIVDLDLDATVNHAHHAVHHLGADLDLDADAFSSTTLATRTTGLLPNLAAGASFCITLGTSVTLDNGIFLAAGICLCADATVQANPIGGPVRIVASSGQVIEGALAIKLRNSMLFAQFGRLFDIAGALKIANGQLFNLGAAANVCLQVDLFIGHAEHDFSQGVGNCCARRCVAPYVSGPNDQCVCPPANKCRDQCLSGPALECNGQCYLQSQYTCPSGVPVLKQTIPGRKRGQSVQCLGYGKEMCAVSGSVGFECIDIHADIESCGGCVLSKAGKRRGTDCTSIPFVNEVLCHVGDCLVISCEKGYKPARNGTLCIDVNLDLDAHADIVTDLRTDLYGKTTHRLDTILNIDASVH